DVAAMRSGRPMVTVFAPGRGPAATADTWPARPTYVRIPARGGSACQRRGSSALVGVAGRCEEGVVRALTVADLPSAREETPVLAGPAHTAGRGGPGGGGPARVVIGRAGGTSAGAVHGTVPGAV